MSNQAARLKALRQKMGLNQQQVADKIGKSRPRIAIYETQPQVRIPADVLQKLAKLYRTTADYIENGAAATLPRHRQAPAITRLPLPRPMALITPAAGTCGP
jgi:transcriptional regulator with XRE-family HTH domain